MRKSLFYIGFVSLCFFFLFCGVFGDQEKTKMMVWNRSYLDNSPVSSDAYRVKNGLIRGVAMGTDKKKFLENLKSAYGELKVTCDSGMDTIGTGCVVVNSSGTEEIERYEVVVTGDVTGDGERSITDMTKLLSHVREKKELKDPYLKAADVNYDKSVVDLDVQILAQYALEGKEFAVPDDNYEEDDGRYATITLSATSVQLEKGKTQKIEATVNHDKVTILKWESADEKVAVVDSNGLITAVGGGSTKITVTASNGKTASIQVLVKVPTTGVSLNLSGTKLLLGGEVQLKAIVSPADADNKTVTWISENNDIAIVDANGKVVGKSVGSVTISAKTVDGFNANCLVEVDDLLDVKVISSDDSILLAGDTITYTLEAVSKVATSIDLSKIHFYTQSPINYQLEEYNGYSVVTEGSQHKVSLNVPKDISKLGLLRVVVDDGAMMDQYGNVSPSYSKDDYVVSLNLNATAQSEDANYGKGDAAISIAVGVDNSFYAKSFDYYVNDTLVSEGSTTNSLVYHNNLTNGSSYQVDVQVSLYRDRLIQQSSTYYSSQTGEVATIESLSNDVIKGSVSKSVTVPTSKTSRKVAVDFIDVSESVSDFGDSIYVNANGKTILIDTGSRNLKDGGDTVRDGERVVEVIKEKLGNTTCSLDYLMFTHSDIDHTGGAAKVLSACTVKNIVVAVNHYNGYEGYYALGAGKNVMYPIDYAISNDINLILLTAGNVLNIGGILFNVFNPYNSVEVPNSWLYAIKDGGIRANMYNCDYYESSVKQYSCENQPFQLTFQNNNSIVFQVLNGGEKILLMGDAQFYTEELLLGLATTNTGIKISDPFVNVTASGLKYHLESAQYMSLLTDIMNAEGLTKEQAISKYKLDRFTEKDVSATIMKRGHHAYVDTGSIDFLYKVQPDMIIASASKYESLNLYSIVPYLRNLSEERIATYFKNVKGVTITSSNWQNYILAPHMNTTSDYKRGTIGFYTYGREWTRSS